LSQSRKWAASPGKTREQPGASSIVWHGSAVFHGRQPEKKADLPFARFNVRENGRQMSQLGHSLQVRPRPLVHKCPLCINTDRKFWALGFVAMCQNWL